MTKETQKEKKLSLPFSIKLEHPVEWGQTSKNIITHIEVKRRFKMGDFRDMTERDLESTAAAVTMISKITAETEALIWELDPLDFSKVVEAITPFFPKSLGIGPPE
jgi:hypothetical protein